MLVAGDAVTNLQDPHGLTSNTLSEQWNTLADTQDAQAHGSNN